jgi:sugar phosphate isomerase/epimerase
MKNTRRYFIYQSLLAAVGLAAGKQTMASATSGKHFVNSVLPARRFGEIKICIFSKHLQWLNYPDMASAAAALGFDGIDLTVRRKGHVEPERVAEDLPKAVKALEQAGLKVYMLTTDITSADQPYTELVLRTAAQLGIRYYRMGWLPYQENMSIEQSLENFKQSFSKLATLNKQYQIHGAYQNHAGSRFGAALWDLWLVIKDIDPQWLGCQYDIRHATVEGSSSWPLGLQLMRPHIRTLDIKDFKWANKNGNWQLENVSLGEGMVNFSHFFKLLKDFQIKGPVSLHYEYALDGAETGSSTLAAPKDKVLEAMKKDLITLRKWISEAGLN